MSWRRHVLCWRRMMGSILLLRWWGRDLLLLGGCLMQLTWVRAILCLGCGWLRRLGCKWSLRFVRRVDTPRIIRRGSCDSYYVAGSRAVGVRGG